MIDFLEGCVSSWDYLKSARLPIIIYGMGNGADLIIKRLEQDKLTVADFFASDEFVRGQSFHGKPVKRLSQIESEYGDFIVVVAFGSSRLSVMENIKSIARRHDVIIPTVPVFGSSIFDSDFARENEGDILKTLDLFEEEASREIYREIIKFEYTGRLEHLLKCESDKSEAYKNILKLSNRESYLDLGAYRGDTVDEFLRFAVGYSRITALEPDKKSYEKLCEHCSSLENFEPINAAVWSDARDIFFDRRGGRMSAVSSEGIRLCGVSIDGLNSGRSFTYIKADVEGCERQALLGARRTLALQKPKLNFALYHRGGDIFRLPLLIKELQPEYKFFIRHHPYIPAWDTNLYCI